jgi:hypothetical protein
MAPKSIFCTTPPVASADVHQTSVTLQTSIQQVRNALPGWLDFLDRGTFGHNVHNDPRMILLTLDEQSAIQPRVLMVYQGRRLMCVAPFYIEPTRYSFEFSVWRIPFLKAQALRVFGESIVLAADADLQPCVNAVLDFLKTLHPSINYLQIYGMKQSDQFWRAMLHAKSGCSDLGWALFTMRPEKIHKAILKSSFDEYVGSLSSSTRQTLRYSTRRFLANDRGRFEKLTKSSDVSKLLECVEVVFLNSWQSSIFKNASSKGRRKFFEYLADQGWLRSYLLLKDERPVAYQIGLQYGQTYYLLDCAFDQEFAEASPGSVLAFSVMEDLHADGSIGVWDFGFGDMPYKRRLATVTDEASIAYFAPPGRWRALLALQVALNKVYDTLRDNFIRLKIDRFIRKCVKRQR